MYHIIPEHVTIMQSNYIDFDEILWIDYIWQIAATKQVHELFNQSIIINYIPVDFSVQQYHYRYGVRWGVNMKAI